MSSRQGGKMVAACRMMKQRRTMEFADMASTSVRKNPSSQREPAEHDKKSRKNVGMTSAPVPDFFQEETPDAIRHQVDWLIRELGLDDTFFAKLLATNASKISKWRRHDASDLPAGGIETLRLLWQTMLHLLSFLNFDQARVRDLFQQTTKVGPAGGRSSLTPPWGGSSLKAYLEKSGAEAIEKVDTWVTGLRFGDPYAA